MKRLLIDTNVILDVLAKREEFYRDAALLFSLADKKEVILTVSSLTFANTYYILAKQKSKKEARTILRKLKVLVETLSLDDKVTELALNDAQFTDFEDGLQYYSALENAVDVIITRNKKDFSKSMLPVLTPKEFLLGV